MSAKPAAEQLLSAAVNCLTISNARNLTSASEKKKRKAPLVHMHPAVNAVVEPRRPIWKKDHRVDKKRSIGEKQLGCVSRL